jgi:hypothetical protein
MLKLWRLYARGQSVIFHIRDFKSFNTTIIDTHNIFFYLKTRHFYFNKYIYEVYQHIVHNNYVSLMFFNNFFSTIGV